MGRISRLEIKESELELNKLRKIQVKSKNVDRLKALIYIKQNKFSTREELAEYMGYTRRSIEKWLAAYKSGGMDKMLLPSKRVRKSYLIPANVDNAIKQRVYDEHQGFSSYVEAQNWLATEFGLDLKYNTVREHLIRHFKTKIKSPRKSHIKKDPEAVKVFLKTT